MTAAYLQHVFGNVNALPAHYSHRDLVKWWEARRLRYNLLIGSVGIVTWVVVAFAGSMAVKLGEDFVEPSVMIIGPIIYAVTANLCFCLGWAIDMIFYRGHPRSFLYKWGLILSVIITALPGVWAVAACSVTLYTGRRFG